MTKKEQREQQQAKFLEENNTIIEAAIAEENARTSNKLHGPSFRTLIRKAREELSFSENTTTTAIWKRLLNLYNKK